MLSQTFSFSPERDGELFAALPAAPAVFLLRGEDTEPYISKTTNLRRRLQRLLGKWEGSSRRLNLRERVCQGAYSVTGSDFESSLLLYRTLRAALPKNYRERLRLRFAPLARFDLDNPYPRAYVTRRITGKRGSSVYYGPFPARAAAEKYLSDALDLFKIRRCDFELHPDPAFPGCIYSEMKMCLAPCFRGCSEEDYAAEVARVRAFLDSGGQSLVRELSGERDQASAALEFETAAALHARLEKVSAATRLPEIVRRLDLLSGVLVQPSAEKECVALFPFHGGVLLPPIAFPVQQSKDGKAQSMESRLEELLGAPGGGGGPNPPAARASAAELMENIALLKRWYYRSAKVGEIYLSDEKGQLPLRRLVRGVARVFRGEKAETDPLTTAARESWLARTRAPEPG